MVLTNIWYAIFYTQACIPSDQLLICLEPEAASLHCRLIPLEKQDNDLQTFRPGTRYLVLDAGGIIIFGIFFYIEVSCETFCQDDLKQGVETNVKSLVFHTEYYTVTLCLVFRLFSIVCYIIHVRKSSLLRTPSIQNKKNSWSHILTKTAIYRNHK